LPVAGHARDREVANWRIGVTDCNVPVAGMARVYNIIAPA